jgi:hypothetical protein
MDRFKNTNILLEFRVKDDNFEPDFLSPTALGIRSAFSDMYSISNIWNESHDLSTAYANNTRKIIDMSKLTFETL